ncbi:unnamed protein product, partial [Ectocarpus sp. 8 AP-2014]
SKAWRVQIPRNTHTVKTGQHKEKANTKISVRSEEKQTKKTKAYYWTGCVRLSPRSHHCCCDILFMNPAPLHAYSSNFFIFIDTHATSRSSTSLNPHGKTYLTSPAISPSSDEATGMCMRIAAAAS